MPQLSNDKIEHYFRNQLGWQDARLISAGRLTGGISRETWKATFMFGDQDSRAAERSVILRLDPETTLLDSNRDSEFTVLRALHNAPGIPVPEAICNEGNPEHIGSSFMALEVLPGCAEIAAILNPPYAAAGKQIARAHFSTLGHIARFDFRARKLDQMFTVPDHAALSIVAYWEKVLRDHDQGPMPITEAALRYLKRRAPKTARVSVVHGDYRLGNCLYLADGTLSGVLDWEMSHLGDPLEDLAWAMHHRWRPSAASQELVAGYLTEDETIAAWEHASQMQVDRAALHWWRLFTCFKCVAIFSAGGDNFTASKGTGELVYALGAWGNDYEETQMLALMGITK